MTKLGLFIVVRFSINNPIKTWIVVPFINKIAFAIYATTHKNDHFFVLKNKSCVCFTNTYNMY
jgi:hypothetical protein